MVIRNAIKSDLNEILEIMNHEILNGTAIYDYQKKDSNYIREFWEQKCVHEMPLLVFEEENKILAYGSFDLFRPKEGYRYCVEHSIYVHHEHNNKGIGKLMLTNLVDLAKKSNRTSMIAGIDGENHKSIQFHEKFGFKIIATLPEVGYKFDTWRDLVLMRLDLK